jgi:hypothetical protein
MKGFNYEKNRIFNFCYLSWLIFFSCNADVSVGGSASIAYSGAGGNTTIIQGGAISFGLSTTTDSGMTHLFKRWYYKRH